MKRLGVAFGVLVATQAACLGPPGLIKGPPGEYLEANAPGLVWATLVGGDRVVIQGPKVISDTIFGWAEGEEITLPLDEVKEVRVQKLSIWRSSIMPTLAVGMGVAAVVLTTRPHGEAPPDTSQECEDTGGVCDPVDPMMRMAP